MPSININGRYCLFPYVGASTTTTFRDSTYVNNICSVSTPNPLGFSLYLPYIPGLTQPNQGLTTIAPGSSYQIISRDAFSTTKWSITYAGSDVDRLPAAINVQSPLFMIGLDKNSIVVPISSYVLGNNSPLSSIGQMRLSPGGAYDAINTFYAEQIKKGQFFGDTHFRSNSAYRLRNRVPFTFFAPLQSEMGNVYAIGNNDGGEYGMGYRNNNNSFPGDNIYGNWDKIVSNNEFQNVTWNGQTFAAGSLAALSSHGDSKALFVLGSNLYGQLGTGSTQQYYPVWTRVAGAWKDIEMGAKHMLAINFLGHLYACGDNVYGQLGIGAGVIFKNALTFVSSGTINTGNYVELAASSYSTMVRTAKGQIYACGHNDNGILGIGNSFVNQNVYTLTQEQLLYTWTSLKAGNGYFVAISNKKLYGCAQASNRTVYFGNVTNTNPYYFVQEDLNLTDVIGVKTTIYGTHIQRENQDRYFVAGFNSFIDNNRLASLSGSLQTNNLSYFTKSLIPSDAQAIASGFFNGIYNISYIQNNLRYNKQRGSVFTQNNDNYYNMFTNMFAEKSTSFTLRGFAPSPTPTQTPTRTPIPTPTPTVTPTTTRINLVPSDAPNILLSVQCPCLEWKSSGDKLHSIRSSDGFETITTQIDWLTCSPKGATLAVSSGNPYALFWFCFDFKDSTNVVASTLGRYGTDAASPYRALKQIQKSISSGSTPYQLNDICTAGTSVALWNGANYDNPSAYHRVTGVAAGGFDMFIHRNSKTAIYIITNFNILDGASTPYGAWMFTVNLDTNTSSSITQIASNRVCFSNELNNTANESGSFSGVQSKTTKIFRKLPDGTVIMRWLYRTGNIGTNHVATASIASYSTPTWEGFSSGVSYEIPDSGNASGKNLPCWPEFTHQNYRFYLAWCTKPYNISSSTPNPPPLYLRNLTTSAQVTVDTNLCDYINGCTDNNYYVKPYDIINDPVTNIIYIAYSKFLSYNGINSSANVAVLYLKRYTSSLTLLDTTELARWSGAPGASFGPTINFPIFSFYVNSQRVLKLILSFGLRGGGSFGGNGANTLDTANEIVMTNTPSLNNTWTIKYNSIITAYGGKGDSKLYSTSYRQGVLSI
jgi:hypothetical protein